MADKLWKFSWDCGRSGRVESVFVAAEGDVNGVIGKNVNFGEILGKHSEVYGTIEESDITKLNVSDEVVKEVTAILGRTWSGHNPLDYYDEEGDE
ncbi:hypothetical protein [Shouchella rhizosphaerae]|uniref:Uncharacterized protein n=1 Tax=Shouchella rhizosphaerae TaxID=866786 RepID=A0ABZ2CWX5_9BACI